MFGLLKSIGELAVDTVRVVAAPIEVIVDVVDAVVKPVADVAEEMLKDVKSFKD